MSKEEIKKIFITGYKAHFDELITSPWEEEWAIEAFEKWWEKLKENERKRFN